MREDDREVFFRRLIARHGPVTAAAFMSVALHHPQHGYYRRGDPIGTDGDFITAPEISQMFGELIGLWFAQCWLDRGAPERITLLELGPGRGTLMADLLRAARQVPAFTRAIAVYMLESSETLRLQQQARLRGAGVPVYWLRTLKDLPPDRPLYLLANEFFDALPIRQFQCTAQGWRQRMVAANEQGELSWRLSDKPAQVENHLPAALQGTAKPGEIWEHNPAAVRTAGIIGRRITAQGGVGLIVDYGHAQPGFGDSLQAVLRHAPVPPLQHPGRCDLTAHVDFSALAGGFRRGGATTALLTQGELLLQLGIRARAAKLLQAADPAQARNVRTALHRLTAPGEMGVLFKALAVYAPQDPPPPAFNNTDA